MRPTTRAAPLLLLVAVLGMPAAARAQGRNQYLAEGIRLIHRHRYAKAVRVLRRGLDLPGIPVYQEKEILGYLGAAYHLDGRAADAVAPWRRRVRLEPDAGLPRDLPRTVRDAYQAVRAATVIIRRVTPSGAIAGQTLTLTAILVDRRQRTSDLLVYYRHGGEPDWQVARFYRDRDRWQARLPLPPAAGEARGYRLEYYLVAQAPEGEVLDGLGGPTEPLTVRVAAPPAIAEGPTGPGGEVASGDRTGRDNRAGRGGRADHRHRTEGGGAVALGLGGSGPEGGTGPGGGRATSVPDLDHPPPAVRRGGGVPTWLWVALGVVAVGAAATTAVVVTHGGGVPSTSLGAVHYPLAGGRQ